MDVSFAFCIFVRPVLSVTNEGKEGFHQRLIERQARGEMDKAVEAADNVETVQRWASTMLSQHQGKLRHWSEAEKRKGGTPPACVVLM